MAKSLAKINEQIARLQREADSIQSTVIARIKREIAQHGLTAGHLFDGAATSSEQSVGTAATKSTKAPKAISGKKAGAKPAKYGDEQGNSWGGMGKRPQWIHAALAAGRSLDEFLLGSKKSSPRSTVAQPEAAAKPVEKTRAKPAKNAAVKVALKTSAKSAPAAAAKRAATKTAKKAAAKKVVAKNTRPVKAAAVAATKAPAKKRAAAKKVAKPAKKVAAKKAAKVDVAAPAAAAD